MSTRVKFLQHISSHKTVTKPLNKDQTASNIEHGNKCKLCRHLRKTNRTMISHRLQARVSSCRSLSRQLSLSCEAAPILARTPPQRASILFHINTVSKWHWMKRRHLRTCCTGKIPYYTLMGPPSDVRSAGDQNVLLHCTAAYVRG